MISKIVYVLIVVVCISLVSLAILKYRDSAELVKEWNSLKSKPMSQAIFSKELIKDLPDAAKRYFKFAISEGTPLFPHAEIDMKGEFSLGSKESPEYMTMSASQILAAPEGFIWQSRFDSKLPISGSDSSKWTRFNLLGLFPVARAGYSLDHRRSAFDRYMAESAFWTPGFLLLHPDTVWHDVGSEHMKVTLNHENMSITLNLLISETGMPVEIHFNRWTNANPEGKYRSQPFGGKLSDFRDIGGYKIPFYVEAGNMYGESEYFPFFKAQVTDFRFITATN